MFDFINDENTHSLIVLALSIAAGLGLGQIRIKGIGLGVSGVLFSGLFLGHLGFVVEPHVLSFARDFGLVLFIFAVGIQVGPGFADSFRRQGLQLNTLATGITLLQILVAAGLVILTGQPASAVIGLFSGATTSTPALAAAAGVAGELGIPDLPAYITNLSLGCAVAYPFGIIGVIVVLLGVRRLGGIDTRKELAELREEARKLHPVMHIRNLEVTNPNLFGKPLGDIPGLEDMGVTISRVMTDGKVYAASPNTILTQGMLVHVVGELAQLDRAELIIGPQVDTNLQASHGKLEVRYFLVTNTKAVGKTLQTLHLTPLHGVTVTRIRRAGMELAPRRFRKLNFGDKVVCVGQHEHLNRAEQVLGNSSTAYNHPPILPIFVGITLGLLVGSIPVAFPGLSSGFRLGLAGGPLLVAIVLSRVQQFAGMTWYLPTSADALLREVGISLFLTCIGLGAGADFVQSIMSDTGLMWLWMGALITVLPLIVCAWFCRAVLRMNFVTLCGLLVGSMTSAPTLAFASDMLESDAPASVYATVYPLSTILRLLGSQVLVLAFWA